MKGSESLDQFRGYGLAKEYPDKSLQHDMLDTSSPKIPCRVLGRFLPLSVYNILQTISLDTVFRFVLSRFRTFLDPYRKMT
jgi:hypothetical protein